MKSLYRLTSMLVCILGVSAPLAATADYYAAHNGQGQSPPYISWTTAASNIQDAVNAATNGATVWVGAGTYTLPPNATNYPGGSPNVVYINKPLVLRSSNGVPATTIIDGQGANRGVAWTYGSAGKNPFVFDGFTVSNCFATNQGGGILFAGASWTGIVHNCIIQGNIVTNTATRQDGGGGMFTLSSIYYMISNCTFRGNTCYQSALTGGGGGAYLQNSSYARRYSVIGRIDNCLFEDNVVIDGCGGGVCFFGKGIHEIHNTVIRGNAQIESGSETSERGGGGLQHSYDAGVRMWNCLIYGNRSDGGYAGGIYNVKASYEGNPLFLYNCVIVSNSAPGSYNYGGGIRTLAATDSVRMYNCIVRSNSPVNIFLSGTAVSHFVHCSVPTNYLTGIANGPYVWGPGSFTNEPQFVDFAGQNFHLNKDMSPCINVGTNQAWWMAGAVDLDGNRRIDGTFNRVDMGCYEYVYQGSVITIQ